MSRGVGGLDETLKQSSRCKGRLWSPVEHRLYGKGAGDGGRGSENRNKGVRVLIEWDGYGAELVRKTLIQ